MSLGRFIPESLKRNAVYTGVRGAFHRNRHRAKLQSHYRALGEPENVVAFGGALGDALLLTCLIREWHTRTLGPLWVLNEHRDLFQNLPGCAGVLPPNPDTLEALKAHCPRLITPHYAPHDFAHDRDTPPRQHILAELCAQAGLTGTIALRPELHLTAEEVEAQSAYRGLVCMHSTGLGARYPMMNKEWAAGRFQAVAARLGTQHPVVQLGLPGDPPLPGAIDLRGKTGLRETAAVLANARLFVGQVGFLMHLARAVDCPSVIIYGGREPAALSGYSANTNLVRTPACAPCWRWNTCDHDRRCLSEIGVDEVITAIEARLTASTPQSVETCLLA